MKSAQLLNHFDRLSDAPDAIPRLRRFILDLAVRGKLLKQDPRDEPAGNLLKRIETEKATGTIADKQYASITAIEGADTPFQAPAGWMWLRFGSIHDLVRGVTYTKSDAAETRASGYLAILRANNIGVSLNFQDLVFVRKECVGPDQMLRRGDYMIALSSGSKNLVGKAAFVAADYPGGFGGFCGVIRLISHSLEAFVGVFLSSRLYRDAISAGSRGIGINNLKRETLNDIPFPLPPLAEQQRIVAKVDELMALCDRLEAAQTERESQRDRLVASSLNRLNNGAAPDAFRDHTRFTLDHLPRLTTRTEHIQQLRQTILKLAVRGKLVHQDPNDEAASELLTHIQEEKARLAKHGGLKKDKVVWDGLPNEPPHKLPTSWVWTCLQDVFEISRGGSPRPAGDPQYFGGSIPWITVGEITKDQGKYLENTEAGLTEEGALRSRYISPGDLLLTNSGATLGVPKISRIRACMNDGVAVLRLFHSVPLNDFAYIYLHSQTQAFRRVNQGMGQPNLNTQIIAGWFFPLPPLAEQQRIVAKVEELMALCDRLEAQLITTQSESRRLLEATLHHALSS